MSPLSRRAFLAGTAATAVVGAAGAAGLSLPSAEAATTFTKGADLSWVPQMEAAGYYWLNSSGVKTDILTIMKSYGVTAARLRTWVNPSSDPANGHCSIDETAAMALRCKNAGLQVMIDMHFGDTWNSVGVQNPPAAWAGLSYAAMLTAMDNYVYHAMNVLKYNKVTPAWVQLGNEINAGICLPTGSLAHYPAQMTGLLNGAHDMVKEVFPSAQTIIHLAQPQNQSTILNFLDTYKANGGQWDISGFSSYGSGTATIDTIVGTFSTVASRYGKPTMQVEFGGRWDRASRTYDDLAYFIQRDRAIGGLGLFYWEPECYSPFTDYNMGSWDPATREPTTALNAFAV